MNLSESFLTALDSILANKMRSILTMLGVIIGVAAVIALMAIGNGVSATVTSEITSIGTNLMSVSPDMENSGGYPPLSVGDVEALADRLNAPAVTAVAPACRAARRWFYGGESLNTTVNGVTANYLEVSNLADFQAGDGLTQNDVDTKARVAVLGSGVTDLFGDEYPVGQGDQNQRRDYEVVGVLASRAAAWRQPGRQRLHAAHHGPEPPLPGADAHRPARRSAASPPQAASETQADAAIDQITEILRAEHKIARGDDDDFQIFSQTDCWRL